MKRKLVLMVYSVAMLLMVNGCGNNVTINDIQEIDKTPVIESTEKSTEESTHVDILSEIEQNVDDEKIDYSWASHEIVKQSFNNVVDDSLIDFYIGASMHLWANASQNFKLEIEKDDSYFWNTIGYDNYNDFYLIIIIELVLKMFLIML